MKKLLLIQVLQISLFKLYNIQIAQHRIKKIHISKSSQFRSTRKTNITLYLCVCVVIFYLNAVFFFDKFKIICEGYIMIYFLVAILNRYVPGGQLKM